MNYSMDNSPFQRKDGSTMWLVFFASVLDKLNSIGGAERWGKTLTVVLTRKQV
jgi:hypothetical protein